MADKIFNARIVHKHDTETNWLKATNFTPKQGEIIVYDVDSTHTYERFKIGDGVTNVNSLPFISTDVDAALSATSTNPVQNMAVNSAITNLNTLIGDKSVSEQIASATSTLVKTVDGFTPDTNGNVVTDHIVVATSSEGAMYSATVPGLTELKAGTKITIVADTTSTSSMPMLNVNGLGSKLLARHLSAYPEAPVGGISTSWFVKDLAYNITFTGSYWFFDDFPKPYAADIDGVVSVEHGGTGANTADVALTNLGVKDYVSEQMSGARDSIALIDRVNGCTYIVCMINGELTSYYGIKSIAITTLPTKTEYMVGDVFDPSGMVVTATAYDGSVREISDYSYSHDALTEDITSIDIVCTESGATCKATVSISVAAFDPAVVLVDFTYVDNGNGKYTITGWKGTYNGVESTEMIIPSNIYVRV